MGYEEILQGMLERIPERYDKREGSFFWTVLGPIAWGISQCYYILQWAVGLVYPDTATGMFLDYNTAAFGVDRKPAGKAKRRVHATDSTGAPLPLTVGEKLGQGGILFTVVETAVDGGVVEAVEAGSGPNVLTGELLPLGAMPRLGGARLGELVRAGTDIEGDEELRGRFWLSAREQPFGGNPADYRQRTLTLEGVGACVVFPVWQGEGTVKLLIGDMVERPATGALVEKVQAHYGDPALGGGAAPVGHRVTVGTAVPLMVTVSGKLRIRPGSSFAVLEPRVRERISAYIASIDFTGDTVFLAQATVAALSVDGVLDVQELKLCEKAENLLLEKAADCYETPAVGAMTFTEVV